MFFHTLAAYVIGVVVVFGLLVSLSWLKGGRMQARHMTIFAIGFLVGMLAMFIAVHVYSY